MTSAYVVLDVMVFPYVLAAGGFYPLRGYRATSKITVRCAIGFHGLKLKNGPIGMVPRPGAIYNFMRKSRDKIRGGWGNNKPRKRKDRKNKNPQKNKK